MNWARGIVDQNAQHRTDEATGAWMASGKGSARVHRSFSGWELRKVVNTGRWTIHRPDGSHFLIAPAGMDQSAYSLTHAKYLADQAGAQAL